MRYEVTLRGPRSAANPLGTVETVIVDADSGDEAAAQAFMPHKIISAVVPAPKAKAK
jgi:hypothetical protein